MRASPLRDSSCQTEAQPHSPITSSRPHVPDGQQLLVFPRPLSPAALLAFAPHHPPLHAVVLVLELHWPPPAAQPVLPPRSRASPARPPALRPHPPLAWPPLAAKQSRYGTAGSAHSTPSCHAAPRAELASPPGTCCKSRGSSPWAPAQLPALSPPALLAPAPHLHSEPSAAPRQPAHLLPPALPRHSAGRRHR